MDQSLELDLLESMDPYRFVSILILVDQSLEPEAKGLVEAADKFQSLF